MVYERNGNQAADESVLDVGHKQDSSVGMNIRKKKCLTHPTSCIMSRLRTPNLLRVLCSNPSREYFEARDIYCCENYIAGVKYKLLRQ